MKDYLHLLPLAAFVLLGCGHNSKDQKTGNQASADAVPLNSPIVVSSSSAVQVIETNETIDSSKIVTIDKIPGEGDDSMEDLPAPQTPMTPADMPKQMVMPLGIICSSQKMLSDVHVALDAICIDGKATKELVSEMSDPYAGGDVIHVKSFSMKTEKGERKYIVIGVTEVTKSYADTQTKLASLSSGDAGMNNVTLTRTVTATRKPVDGVDLGGRDIEADLAVDYGPFTRENSSVLQEDTKALSADKAVIAVQTILKEKDPANQNQPDQGSLSFYFASGASSTMVIQVRYQKSIANFGRLESRRISRNISKGLMVDTYSKLSK